MVKAHAGNVGFADDCRRVVAEVLDQQGHIDILVNNAGITIDKTHAKLTDDDWNHVLAVNLSGAFFLAQGPGRPRWCRPAPPGISTPCTKQRRAATCAAGSTGW